MNFFRRPGRSYQPTSTTEESQEFIEHDIEYKEELPFPQPQYNLWPRLRLSLVLIFIINILLLGGNMAFWVVNNNPQIAEKFVIPQLKAILKYDVLFTDVGIGHSSPYGHDTDEADALWREISHDGPYGWINVQKEDLREINQTSVRLTDNTGYIVGLEVFHEMHCLNYFRRKILGRPFKANEDPMPEYHLSHCLDIVRLSLQCNADLSLMPVRWVENYPFPWPNFQTTRQCKNWDSIVTWTHENSIQAIGRTIHPKLGKVDGKDIDPSTLPSIGNIQYIDEDEDW